MVAIARPPDSHWVSQCGHFPVVLGLLSDIKEEVVDDMMEFQFRRNGRMATDAEMLEQNAKWNSWDEKDRAVWLSKMSYWFRNILPEGIINACCSSVSKYHGVMGSNSREKIGALVRAFEKKHGRIGPRSD